MDAGLLARIIDRVVANARVIRGAPEAVALVGTITRRELCEIADQFDRTVAYAETQEGERRIA